MHRILQKTLVLLAASACVVSANAQKSSKKNRDNEASASAQSYANRPEADDFVREVAARRHVGVMLQAAQLPERLQAGELLTLTRSCSDPDGRPQSPSPFWSALREMFPAALPRQISRDADSPADAIGTPRQLITALMRSAAL